MSHAVTSNNYKHGPVVQLGFPATTVGERTHPVDLTDDEVAAIKAQRIFERFEDKDREVVDAYMRNARPVMTVIELTPDRARELHAALSEWIANN